MYKILELGFCPLLTQTSGGFRLNTFKIQTVKFSGNETEWTAKFHTTIFLSFRS